MNQVLKGGGRHHLVVVFFLTLLCSSNQLQSVIADSVQSYDEVNNDGIAWSWTLLSTSPCFANGGNAFEIQTSILFTSKSNQTYTYRLTSDFGEFVEPPRDITLDPNGQITFPYTYNNPGMYSNEYKAEVLTTDRTGSSSFNSPWTIQDDGTCINTPSPSPTAAPASNPTDLSDPLLKNGNSGGAGTMMMMTTTNTVTTMILLVGGFLFAFFGV